MSKEEAKAEELPGLTPAVPLVAPMMPKSPSVKRDMNRFPEKLMRILDSEEYKDIFSWSKSGKSIVIHQPYELIGKVLVKHFDAKEDMKFDSFLRKLYRWGFSKKPADEEDGDEEGAHIYIHPNFQKGKLDECAKVVCTSKPTNSRPQNKRPNFGANMFYGPGYGMPFHQQQMMMMHGMYNPMMPMPPAGANGEAAGDRREQEAMMYQQQQQFMRNGGNPMMMYNMYGMPYMMPPPPGEEAKDGEAPKDDAKPPVDGAIASAAEGVAPVQTEAKSDTPAVGEKRDISTMAADQPGGAEESEKKKLPEV